MYVNMRESFKSYAFSNTQIHTLLLFQKPHCPLFPLFPYANNARAFCALWSAAIHCRFAVPGIHSLLFSPPRKLSHCAFVTPWFIFFYYLYLSPRWQITSIISVFPPNHAPPLHHTQHNNLSAIGAPLPNRPLSFIITT